MSAPAMKMSFLPLIRTAARTPVSRSRRSISSRNSSFTDIEDHIPQITPSQRQVLSLTCLTPIDAQRTQVTQIAWSDHPAFTLLRPVIGAMARTFLRQDADMVKLQNEGLKYDPPLMWIDDELTQEAHAWAAARTPAARLIDADMRANGGTILLGDLKNYAPKDMAPLTGLVVKSLITKPLEAAVVAPGNIDVAGFAWAASRELAPATYLATSQLKADFRKPTANSSASSLRRSKIFLNRMIPSPAPK